jgi:hypothetical protein
VLGASSLRSCIQFTKNLVSPIVVCNWHVCECLASPASEPCRDRCSCAAVTPHFKVVYIQAPLSLCTRCHRECVDRCGVPEQAMARIHLAAHTRKFAESASRVLGVREVKRARSAPSLHFGVMSSKTFAPAGSCTNTTTATPHLSHYRHSIAAAISFHSLYIYKSRPYLQTSSSELSRKRVGIQNCLAKLEKISTRWRIFWGH